MLVIPPILIMSSPKRHRKTHTWKVLVFPRRCSNNLKAGLTTAQLPVSEMLVAVLRTRLSEASRSKQLVWWGCWPIFSTLRWITPSMQKRIVWDDSPLYSLRVFCVLQSSGARMIWPPFLPSTRSLATCCWLFSCLLVPSYRSQFHLSVLFIMLIECAVIHLVMIFRPCILVSKLLWFYVPRQRRDASCQVNFLNMLVGSIRSEIILSFSTSFISSFFRSWSAFRRNRHESEGMV